MYERFTDRARKVMQLANANAHRLGMEYIGTEHILLGFVDEGGGNGIAVLRNCGIDHHAVAAEVGEIAGPPKPGERVVMGKLPHTPRAKKIVEYAIEEARNLNHNYVGTEHILLAMIREHEGIAGQVLARHGVTIDKVRGEVLNVLAASAPSCSPPHITGPVVRLGEWTTTFVSSAEVEHLRAELAERDETIASLTADRDRLTAMVDGRDKTIAEFRSKADERSLYTIKLQRQVHLLKQHVHDAVWNHVARVTENESRCQEEAVVAESIQADPALGRQEYDGRDETIDRLTRELVQCRRVIANMALRIHGD